ncbi:hypothetical protein RBY4I_1072 [Rhodobacterales bacterium Y4I]|nr:hypothetical protein RBY4I_1072 [Rhodobacterales bacterium Y4I]
MLRGYDWFAAGAKEYCFSSMAKHQCRDSPHRRYSIRCFEMSASAQTGRRILLRGAR